MESDDELPTDLDDTTIDFGSSYGGLSGSYLISNGGTGSTWANMAYVNGSTINVTGANNITTPTYNYTVNSTVAATTLNASGGLVCNGDADFKGDVKINGRSIAESLSEIEKRLSILVPDPKKLAKYEALQKAYNHYKTLEAMCHDDE